MVHGCVIIFLNNTKPLERLGLWHTANGPPGLLVAASAASV